MIPASCQRAAPVYIFRRRGVRVRWEGRGEVGLGGESGGEEIWGEGNETAVGGGRKAAAMVRREEMVQGDMVWEN